ncbi:hypothetical protein [Paraburkholderia jirisanensis]
MIDESCHGRGDIMRIRHSFRRKHRHELLEHRVRNLPNLAVCLYTLAVGGQLNVRVHVCRICTRLNQRNDVDDVVLDD